MSADEAPRTFCFDLDGTLCSNTYGAYGSAEPFGWAIARVNALARAGNRIIIFTARGSSTGVDWEATTREQLDRWSVAYDELRFGKPTADVFVDDRAYSAEGWRWGHTSVVPSPGAEDTVARAQQLGIAGLTPPNDVVALETGRTYGGTAHWADEHVARVIDESRRAGVEIGARSSDIRASVLAAVAPRAGTLGSAGDVSYSIAVSGHRDPAFLDLYTTADYPVVAIGCRPISEPLSAASSFGAVVDRPTGEVRVRASFSSDVGTPVWPLRDPGDGTVRDGLGGDLAVVLDGALAVPFTDRPRSVILGKVIEIASRSGISVDATAIGCLPRAALSSADEVVLVNEPFGLLPLISIGGEPVGTGAVGPVTAGLLRAISEQVGLDITGQTAALIGG